MSDEGSWRSRYQAMYDNEDHFQRLPFLKIFWYDLNDRVVGLSRHICCNSSLPDGSSLENFRRHGTIYISLRHQIQASVAE